MNKTLQHRAALLAAFLALAVPAGAAVSEPASAATAKLQAALRERLPLADRQAFDDARRGFVGTTDAPAIRDASGRVVWSFAQFAFLQQEAAPDSVHPVLWRHARLNTIHGLFKVTDRVFQVRGFDLSNVTIVEADNGLIVVDPLTTTETARAALDLYFQHRPRKPVVAVVYTHSHADHFGGVRAVVDEADVRAGKVAVIAPAGFLAEAVSENILAGNAMYRRSQYQFGSNLPRNAQGFVDAGLGKGLTGGSITLIAPTDVVNKPLETRRIDGIDIVFQNTPGTEAPAEMNLYFPQFRVFDVAENATHTLHNLLPLRGAQVRDANGWAKYLNDALEQFGGRSDVLISQHMWPVWGSDRLAGFLARQRDTYKFIHDQTLRLTNKGYTADEIAEQVRMPASLEQDLSTHGVYGAVRHNVKAVYQRYLGWYDANPANLDPPTKADAAVRTVAYMGGADAVLKRAQADFDKGEYRWVAQVANLVVQAAPDNRAARDLAARAFEQLGYQAEASTWRNAYLSGAQELRDGPPAGRVFRQNADFLKALSVESMFDYLGVRVDPQAAEGRHVRINWQFTDSGERYVLNLENSALTYVKGKQDPQAGATLSLSKDVLAGVISGAVSYRDAIARGDIRLRGKQGALDELLGVIEALPATFPIVLPRGGK